MTLQKQRDEIHFQRLRQQANQPLPEAKPKQHPIVFVVPKHGRKKARAVPFGFSGVPMPALNTVRGQGARSKSLPPPKMAPNFAEKRFATTPRRTK
jgi:hypothetical protein